MASISINESVSIRYLRAIATILIVACHFLQSQGNRWAYVLNVGVQLFFVMSGYLYGLKRISDWGGYFYSRWRKLYIPYFVFFVVILLLLKILHVPGASFEDFIKLTYLCQGFLITHSLGLGHLWFITAIFACYWLTPLLQKITSWKQGNVNGVLLLIFGLLSFGLFYKGFGYGWYYAWFFNYIVGYLLAKINIKYRYTYLLISSGLLLLIVFKITWPDIIKGTSINLALHGYLAHVLFILFIVGSKLIKREELIQPLKLIEQYSLYIYFVHYPFTRVPWTVVGSTSSVSLDIIILILAITLSTVLLKILSNYSGMIVDKILNETKIQLK